MSSSRDHMEAKLRIADAATGAIRDVLEETVETFYESGNGRANWRVLFGSNEVIWFSQRDDWGHLYLYDLASGKLKHWITGGEGNVTQLLCIHEKDRIAGTSCTPPGRAGALARPCVEVGRDRPCGGWNAVDWRFDEPGPAGDHRSVTPADEYVLYHPDPLAVERVLFQSDLVHIGAFRCPPDHSLFEDSGPIVNPIFVFPRTAVWIEHEHRAPFVADPSVATVYNRGQVYRRRRLSAAGDACDWFALAPRVLAEMADAGRREPAGESGSVFSTEYVPVDAGTYLRQREIVDRLERGACDALQIEEQVVSLASAVVGRTFARATPPARSSSGGAARRRRDDAIEHARALLATRFRQPLSLGQVAGAVALSVFHLCRIFRHCTGLTVHEYRTTLRLRHALARLTEPRVDLTDVALDAGFSSHSHFTSVFRRHFGVTPSAAARQLHAPVRERCGRRRFEARAGKPTLTAP